LLLFCTLDAAKIVFRIEHAALERRYPTPPIDPSGSAA